MGRKTSSFVAWLGVWITFCAIGEHVIQFEQVAWTMMWGVTTYWACEGVSSWIEGDA